MIGILTIVVLVLTIAAMGGIALNIIGTKRNNVARDRLIGCGEAS